MINKLEVTMKKNSKKSNLKVFVTHGMADEFQAPRTLQKKGVVERKSESFHEMARTMLNAHKL